jgi:hypothetical protein
VTSKCSYRPSRLTFESIAGLKHCDCCCRELDNLAKGVTSEEVERAKAICANAVGMSLEMPLVVAEDIGRQIVTYGKRVSSEEFKKMLNVCRFFSTCHPPSCHSQTAILATLASDFEMFCFLARRLFWEG